MSLCPAAPPGQQIGPLAEQVRCGAVRWQPPRPRGPGAGGTALTAGLLLLQLHLVLQAAEKQQQQ